MAELKQYGYYLKGNRISIVERDTTFDNDLNSKDFGPGSDRAQWKSPLSSIADGLEIQYCYSPKYTLTGSTIVTGRLTKWRMSLNASGNNLDGYLSLVDGDSSGIGYYNFTTTLSIGQYFVLKKAGKFNGLHRVQGFEDYDTGTNNVINTWTKPIGLNKSTAMVDFEEEPDMYAAVDVLKDEFDNIDLPEYLSKALVDYVKAKMFEDARDLESKEYFMREFRKKIERYNNSRVSTMRIVVH